LRSQIEQSLSSPRALHTDRRFAFASLKPKHESELSRVLDIPPPQAYERGADGKRSWWRRALELFGTFRGRHGDALKSEDVAEYRKQKAREELPVTDPERHLGLRVSRLDDMARGLVVDGDVDPNDLGESSEPADEESGTKTNTGYSIHSAGDARNHERPNHLPGGMGMRAALLPRPGRGRGAHHAGPRDRAAEQAGNAGLSAPLERGREGSAGRHQEVDRDGLKNSLAEMGEFRPPKVIGIRRHRIGFDCKRNATLA
jgi:hypothetical protein